jgi:hypothetical protein
MHKSIIYRNSMILNFGISIFLGLLLTNHEQNFVRIADCFYNGERAIIGS